jgi:transposase
VIVEVCGGHQQAADDAGRHHQGEWLAGPPQRHRGGSCDAFTNPEVAMAHRNARLTMHGRRLLIQRVVIDRRPVAHVVEELGVSRATGYKWLARWRAEGDAGLADRASTAHRLPGKTRPELKARVCVLRTQLKRGPRRLAPLLGMPASTVHAVLTRHGLHRLAWLDRPTGTPIRRYERDRPGELIHVDVKKIGRLRDGGGWRVHGRGST